MHTSSNEEPTVERLSNAEKNDRSEEASYVHFSNGSLPQVTTADSNGQCSNTVGSDLEVQQCDGMSAKETKTITQEFTASTPQCYDMIRNGKQNEVMQVSNGFASNSRSHPHGNRTFEDTSQTGFPIDTRGKLPKLGPQQKNQLQLQQQRPQAPGSSFEGVLEALQRAKLSLNQELKKMPSLSQGTLALTAQTNAQTRANSSVDGWDIPIGSASLFRLPSDTFPPAHFSGPKYYGSGLSFPANRPDAGFTSNSYGYRNPTATSYAEGGSRVVPGREYFDNYFGSSMGVPGSNKYSRASSDLSAESAPFRNEFSNSYSDVRNENYGVPSGDRYGLYGGDQTRFDMRML